MKKALILTTGYYEQLEPIVKFIPGTLLQVAGRPILHHICDFLKKVGVVDSYFILHHLPLLIEQKLQEGQRWGIKASFYLCRSDKSPLTTVIPSQLCQAEEMILIGKANELPYFDLPLSQDRDSLYFYPDGTWSGWGVISTASLRSFPLDIAWQEIPKYLKDFKKVICERGFLADSLKDLLESNINLLKKSAPIRLFATDAKMIAPNVWVSRGVSLHPTVKLFPPLFIGRHTSIGKGCSIGPDAIIENYCVVDNGSTIKNSMICSHSYVGQGLNVNNSIVYHNLLVDIHHGTALHIQDEFILSELRSSNYKTVFYHWCESMLAGFMILFLFPFMRKPDKKWVVKSPGNGTELLEWKEGLASLIHVFKGEAYFVGIKPRTMEELDQWSEAGKQLYLRTKLGLITEEDTIKKRSFEEDHSETLDSFYAVNNGFLFDMKLLLKWMGILR